MQFVNRICPRCKNPNYMVSLNGFSNVFQFKCMNCNSYYTDDDFTIRDAPANNDLVEIVRCKDCRFREDPDSIISHWLPCQLVKTADDWFCADGKRKY